MIDSEPIKKYALAPIKTHHISKINIPEPKMHQPLLLIWSIASWGGTTGANEELYQELTMSQIELLSQFYN